VFGDASAVPAQECVWCDEPSVAVCLGDGAEQGLVVVVERGPPVLAAQGDDLDVFGAPRPRGEAGQRREEAVQDAIHAPQDRSVSALLNAHARVSGTDRQGDGVAQCIAEVVVADGFDGRSAAADQSMNQCPYGSVKLSMAGLGALP